MAPKKKPLEIWGVVIAGVALVVSVPFSIKAFVQAGDANETAQTANSIARTANTIADEARKIGELQLTQQGAGDCIDEVKEAIDSMTRLDEASGGVVVLAGLPQEVKDAVNSGAYKSGIATAQESKWRGDNATDLDAKLELYRQSLAQCNEVKKQMGDDCEDHPVECNKVYLVILTEEGLEWLIGLPDGSSLLAVATLGGADIVDFIRGQDETTLSEWLQGEPFAASITADDIYEWSNSLSEEDFSRWLEGSSLDDQGS